jgi:hypothetical protein
VAPAGSAGGNHGLSETINFFYDWLREPQAFRANNYSPGRKTKDLGVRLQLGTIEKSSIGPPPGTQIVKRPSNWRGTRALRWRASSQIDGRTSFASRYTCADQSEKRRGGSLDP